METFVCDKMTIDGQACPSYTMRARANLCNVLSCVYCVCYNLPLCKRQHGEIRRQGLFSLF